MASFIKGRNFKDCMLCGEGIDKASSHLRLKAIKVAKGGVEKGRTAHLVCIVCAKTILSHESKYSAALVRSSSRPIQEMARIVWMNACRFELANGFFDGAAKLFVQKVSETLADAVLEKEERAKKEEEFRSGQQSCEWGQCDDIAFSEEFADERGFLPVCKKHRSEMREAR